MVLSMSKQIILNNQLFKVVALLEKTGNQIFSNFGLTVKTYTILIAISEGCKKSTDLSHYVQGSMASITQKTKWLEEKGLIHRRLDKKDKRIWYFDLTDKGVEIIKKIKPAYEEMVSVLYEPFSKREVEVTIKILNQVEKRLIYKIKNESRQ